MREVIVGNAPDADHAGSVGMATSRVRRNDRAHVLHPWSSHATLEPLVVADAAGAHFRDESGRRWLDFSSQLVNVNVGHQHPRMIAAIRAQAETLCTVAPYHANEATRSSPNRASAALWARGCSQDQRPAKEHRMNRATTAMTSHSRGQRSSKRRASRLSATFRSKMRSVVGAVGCWSVMPQA